MRFGSMMVALAGVAVLSGAAAGAQEEPKKKGMLGGLMSVVGLGKGEKKSDDGEAEKPAMAAEAPPPKAPDMLVAGVMVEGTLKDAPISNGRSRRCYKLETARGSQWDIHVTQKKHDNKYLPALLYAGEGCTNPVKLAEKTVGNYEPTYLGGDWYGTHTKFASGGGVYSIAVVADASEDFGDFRITATQTGGPGSATTGLLPNAGDVAYANAFGKETASTAAPREAGKYSAGDVIKDCPDCPSMVVVPPGQFIMGSTASEEDREGDEGPAHRVKFARAFAIGQLEVNFDQWDACVKGGGCVRVEDNGWGRGKRPVINVSWEEARSYVAWLSKTTGERYYLPSEAEWEYAARAGSKTPWNTGSGIVSDDANILNTFKQTVPGGGFPANAFGLKDVHGNVAEWTLDCYEVGYFGVPEDGGAAVTDNCPMRVVRGGSFALEPKLVRSAKRLRGAPTLKEVYTGFRVTRAL